MGLYPTTGDERIMMSVQRRDLKTLFIVRVGRRGVSLRAGGRSERIPPRRQQKKQKTCEKRDDGPGPQDGGNVRKRGELPDRSVSSS